MVNALQHGSTDLNKGLSDVSKIKGIGRYFGKCPYLLFFAESCVVFPSVSLA